MASYKQLDFFLLRYVPDAVKGEFVNIGVVMLERAALQGGGFTGVRFARDWRRVRCLDPDADVELFEALETDIRARLQSNAMDCSKGGHAMSQREWILKVVADSFSNAVQVTETQAVLAENPQTELAKLADLYLESQARTRRLQAGRHIIFGRMREEFERAGVWPLMRRRIPVADYTGKGDPLKIDCGYRPNGVVRLFHAVSLQTDVDAAKVLAFSLPGLREGILRSEMAKTELTAIVEDELDVRDDGIEFAIQTLKRSEILVSRVRDLPQLAERARVELKT